MEYPDHGPSMDYLSKPDRNLGAQKSLGRSGNNMPRAFQSISNADFHNEIMKSSERSSHQLAGDPQKQRIGVNEVDEDELVKYMSNLPSYLQKGEAVKEKALNVGVLDWGLLEKWRYGQKQMPYRSKGYSPSSSNTSSSFSTDESSTHSSRGHSCSPTRQRMRRPSLQSHLSSSLVEGPFQVVESSGERKFQAIKSTQSGSLNRSENCINTASLLSKKHPHVEIRESRYDASVPNNRERDPGSRALRNGPNTRAAMFEMTKTETETQAIEDKTREEKVQKPNSEHNSSNGNKRIVILLPKGDPESSNSAGPRNSDFAALATRKSRVHQKSFADGCQKACHSEISSDVPRSFPLSLGFGSKKPQVEPLSSRGLAAVSIDCPSASSKSASQPESDPSRGILEAKKEIVPPVSSTSSGHSKASEEKPKKAPAEKARSISPFYRFTSSVSKMSKSSILNDSTDVNNQNSTDMPGKSGRGNSRPSSCDSSSATVRARSSPLRRLLDPLLKPKAENSHHSVEPSERVSAPTDKACKSVDGQHVSFATRSGKVKLGITGCKEISVNELAMGKKHGPSTVQALLRGAVKNGLPLYTFAVNNENNILAATVKMLDARKNDGGGRIYTFFAIQDLKKKNGGWINQGGRGKGQGYVSNVVAQMKASDCGYSDLGTWNIGVRDFVLFSVDLRQAEDQASEFQPKDELAAILVKCPKEISPSSVKDEPVESTSWPDSKERLAGEAQCHEGFRDQDSISTTVILPSAVHSLPSKGGPSSLIERWISGGSCDCGGWDLGCKLRVLTNLERSSSSKGGYPPSDRFELFPQGGLQENQQVFSLTPFKDGIYSVEFHSSISVLQAFSICTAVLDTRKQSEVSDSSHSVEERTSGEPVSAGTSHGETEGDGPRYVPYPPHSPVGRV